VSYSYYSLMCCLHMQKLCFFQNCDSYRGSRHVHLLTVLFLCVFHRFLLPIRHVCLRLIVAAEDTAEPIRYDGFGLHECMYKLLVCLGVIASWFYRLCHDKLSVFCRSQTIGRGNWIICAYMTFTVPSWSCNVVVQSSSKCMLLFHSLETVLALSLRPPPPGESKVFCWLCLSVCLFVRSHIFRNHSFRLHQLTFYAC